MYTVGNRLTQAQLNELPMIPPEFKEKVEKLISARMEITHPEDRLISECFRAYQVQEFLKSEGVYFPEEFALDWFYDGWQARKSVELHNHHRDFSLN